MSGEKKKTDYNSDQIMQEFRGVAADDFGFCEDGIGKASPDLAVSIAVLQEKFVALSEEEQCAALWEALEYFQGCEFLTAKGLKFTYTIRGGEMFVNRKSKSITQATVFMAFLKVSELGGKVSGPKKLGTFGASYLYPIFMRLGLITVSD